MNYLSNILIQQNTLEISTFRLNQCHLDQINTPKNDYTEIKISTILLFVHIKTSFLFLLCKLC